MPTIHLYFSKKELLLNNSKKNLYYLFYQSDSKRLYKKVLNIDIDKNYLYFPPASGFSKDNNITPKINISFIGSNFYSSYRNIPIVFNKECFSILNKLEKNYYFRNTDKKNLIEDLKHLITGQQRIKYLSTISDLGLKIYSNSNWKSDVSLIDIKVADCYQDGLIQTKRQNEDLYNNSKISVNLSHPQATTSFSWRVPDIMASNSCLVMEDKKDWHKLFGKYISSDVKGFYNISRSI